MNILPDEVLLLILQYLVPKDLTACQRISRRFLRLARDPNIWKEICYDHSLAEYARSRWQTDQTSAGQKTMVSKRRYQHNWDPGYYGEKIDYYEEYMHRHVEVNIVWKSLPSYLSRNLETRELAGFNLLTEAGRSHAVCAIDDGSVVIYDLCSQNVSEQVAGHSGPGLLTPLASSHEEAQRFMNKTNAKDVVSIDHVANRGYFAVDQCVHEIDLKQLSLVSSRQYASPITAMSAISAEQPLLVGTQSTICMYDNREQRHDTFCNSDTRLDQVFPRDQHYVTLPEPGPTSILLAPDHDTIWVAGRFKSLLQYSLQNFPRLKSSIFSGAHISSLASYPYPHIGRQWDLMENLSMPASVLLARKSMPGWTVIGAGVYKGKGSLEIYTSSSGPSLYEKYVNRQSASSSKLLSVAIHGSSIVYSDGNAHLTWVNRNGYRFQRMHQIGAVRPRGTDPSRLEPLAGLWESSSHNAADSGAIIQKMIPYHGAMSSSGRRPENLLLWSGDGRLGFLGFGSVDPFQADEYYDALESQAQTAADKAHHDAERQYAMAMRRALQRNADEVRFMRGLGMGDMP